MQRCYDGCLARQIHMYIIYVSMLSLLNEFFIVCSSLNNTRGQSWHDDDKIIEMACMVCRNRPPKGLTKPCSNAVARLKVFVIIYQQWPLNGNNRPQPTCNAILKSESELFVVNSPNQQGVGMKRALELFQRMGNLKAITNASEQDLMTHVGVTRGLAKKIRQFCIVNESLSS